MGKSGVSLKNDSVSRLLEAAERCFGQGGFNGTSLKEIADDAGVSKALIHYHFDTKEGLFLEVLQTIHREIAADVQRIATEGPPGIEAAMRALDELTHAMMRLTPLTPVFVEVGAMALKQSELQRRTQALVSDTVALIEAGIHQTLGAAVGSLQVPPPRLARLLHSVVHGIALSVVYGSASGSDVSEQLADLKVILLGGLFTTEAPPPSTPEGDPPC